LPVGDRDSDIDHVVIGPVGVFTIDAKNHPQANVWVRDDTCKVNGTPSATAGTRRSAPPAC
jgi:hypothetical protein